jgi:ubiquinone/menaquinone biosynthesis C-methylase UbiE
MSTPTPVPDKEFEVWECWWAGIEGAPGEIIWDADVTDLTADLEIFADTFDRDLPVIDLGCGDGRQTRFLARHLDIVVGVDISPAAIDRARATENPPNVSYRVLDARFPGAAQRLHAELGDANVYVRGVLQAMPAGDRPGAISSIAALLGGTGTLFAKELPPQASTYFAEVVQRHGIWPELERVMRLIPPGQVTEEELARLFLPDRIEVIATGAGRIETVNVLPDGDPIRVPAIYALARPGRPVSRPSGRAGCLAHRDDRDLRALKEAARVVWAAGDYPALARMHADAGLATAKRAGAAPGVRLLDVAAGDGNVAIPAARAGAKVTALDLTPKMLEAGRRRAEREQLSVEWVEGDAEELPFEDDSFDAVASNFGAIFAPRHEVAAAELARVCRPGGTIVMTAWRCDGFNNQLAAIGRRYLPEPPLTQPPALWADPDHARACFAPMGVDLSFEHGVAHARFPSVDEAVELGGRAFGPVVLARERLIAEARWDQLRDEVAMHYARWARPVQDGIQIDLDYVVITGHTPERQ